jgi:hypothetical protein
MSQYGENGNPYIFLNMNFTAAGRSGIMLVTDYKIIYQTKHMKAGMFRSLLLVMGLALFTGCLYSCSKEKSFENGGDPSSLRSKEYALNEVGGSGVSGSIVISENNDSSFNILVSVNNSVQDTVHLVHLHNGSPGSGGNVALTLESITGTGGATQSETTNISEIELSDRSIEKMTYDDIIKFTGYVDVHYSVNNDSLIAEGAIGF